MIALIGSTLGAIAGIFQWSALDEVIDRPLLRWIKANSLAWMPSLVVGLLGGVLVGQVLGAIGLNGALFLAGVVAGGSTSDKVMAASVEKLLQPPRKRTRG